MTTGDVEVSASIITTRTSEREGRTHSTPRAMYLHVDRCLLVLFVEVHEGGHDLISSAIIDELPQEQNTVI